MRRVLQALGILTLVIAIGVAGFYWLENMSLLDALFLTIITISTVGYDTVTILSPQGKIFAILLIIFTFGTFLYAVTTLTTFIVEGEIRQLFRRYKVNKEIANLKNHMILCGLGRNGREAALEFLYEKIPFVVVENNADTVNDFLEHHPNVLALVGDATHEDALRDANISQAKGLITALSEDADNVFVTLTAREMNSKVFIVSRASHESTISKLKTAGANKVVVPNMIGGKKMAKILTKPALVDFVEVISGESEKNLELEQVACGNFPGILDQNLIELKIKERTGVLVLGYRSNDGKIHVNPPATKHFENGEILFVLGTPPQLERFREIFES